MIIDEISHGQYHSSPNWVAVIDYQYPIILVYLVVTIYSYVVLHYCCFSVGTSNYRQIPAHHRIYPYYSNYCGTTAYGSTSMDGCHHALFYG
jgi:hypothetical protein